MTPGFLMKQSYDGQVAKLTMNRVVNKDGGYYECVMTNAGGEARTKALLTIVGKSLKG